MQLALLPSSRLQFKATGSDRRYIHMSMCLCVGGEEMERKRNRPLHLISSKALVGSAPPPTSRREMHICRHRSTFCRQRPKQGAERTPLGARASNISVGIFARELTPGSLAAFTFRSVVPFVIPGGWFTESTISRGNYVHCDCSALHSNRYTANMRSEKNGWMDPYAGDVCFTFIDILPTSTSGSIKMCLCLSLWGERAVHIHAVVRAGGRLNQLKSVPSAINALPETSHKLNSLIHIFAPPQSPQQWQRH